MNSLPTSLSQVDYASLAASFVKGIENVLRGFRAPDSPEWLDLWVHDEDPVRSILNIFEAGETAELPGVAVSIDAETLKGIDVSRLEQALAPIGKLELTRSAEGLEVALRFEASSRPALAVAPTSAPVARRALEAGAPLQRCEDLSPYEDAIARVLASVTHEGAPTPADGEVLAQATRSGVTLAIRVDKARKVRQATHQGAGDDSRRAVLEAVCGLLEGRAPVDCADHVVQYAHARLRSSTARRAVPGVAMPHNSHPIFEQVEALVRAVVAEYAARSGHTETSNFEHAGPGADWRAKDDAGRMASVQGVLDAACAELGLPAGACINATAGGSVAMSFVAPIPSRQGGLLRELEDRIKGAIDSALYIHIEAIKDKNKLRVLDDRTAKS